ncbi:MAG: hypothetical protein V3V95_09040 [Thermodesulfobacteriota bacterium]
MKTSYKNQVVTVLALSAVMALSGCVSKRSYDRDVTNLLNKLEKGKGSSADSMQSLQSKIRSKSTSLNKLTNKYTLLEKDYVRASERLNSFGNDLQRLKKDMAELKLVISINIDKLRSTVANEMLIKIIDMEYRIDELLKKESEPLPATTAEEQGYSGQTP